MTVDFSKGYATQGPECMRITLAMCILAGSMAVSRFVSVWLRKRCFGAEDGMALASLMTLIVITILAWEACMFGWGFHSADIKPAGGDLPVAAMYWYLFQIFYKIAICFNKLAFLALYLNLFPSKTTRRIIWVTVGVIIAGTLAFVFATVTECIPIEKNWNKRLPGRCINNTAFRWSWASFNTITDLWVVVLPLPILWALQMPLVKRMGASLIFLVGLFIVATSAIRMKAIDRSVTHSDIPWDSMEATIWSQVEASVGLMVTCMPALKLRVQGIFPNGLSGSAKHGRSRRSSAALKLSSLLDKRRNPRRRSDVMGLQDKDLVYIMTETTTPGAEEVEEARQSQNRTPRPTNAITIMREVSVKTHDPVPGEASPISPVSVSNAHAIGAFCEPLTLDVRAVSSQRYQAQGRPETDSSMLCADN